MLLLVKCLLLRNKLHKHLTASTTTVREGGREGGGRGRRGREGGRRRREGEGREVKGKGRKNGEEGEGE